MLKLKSKIILATVGFLALPSISNAAINSFNEPMINLTAGISGFIGTSSTNAKSTTSFSPQFYINIHQHYNKYIPNLIVNYTKNENSNSKFDQASFIGYYKLLSGKLYEVGAGISFNNTDNISIDNRYGSEALIPGIYLYGKVYIPNSPFSIFTNLNLADGNGASIINYKLGLETTFDVYNIGVGVIVGYQFNRYKFRNIQQTIETKGPMIGANVQF